MMRLVQISDCHLHADPAARARAGFPLRQLEAVVAEVNRERPDMVLVTGDISNDETAASYQLAVRTLGRLAAPWFWLPGNHDDPALMAETRELLDELDIGDWRILMLDTRVSGQAHGELGPERLAELAARLEEDDRPTLLAMHHPPLPVGSAWIDALGLKDREAFWQTLSAYRQVCAPSSAVMSTRPSPATSAWKRARWRSSAVPPPPTSSWPVPRPSPSTRPRAPAIGWWTWARRTSRPG